MKTTIRRMAAANPVPDPGQLHPDQADVEQLFSSIERRRDEMIGAPRRPSPDAVRPPEWRRWYRRPAIVFLMALGLVLLIGAPLVLLGGGEGDVAESTVASTTTAPETTIPSTTMPSATTPPTSAPTTATTLDQSTGGFEAGDWELVLPPVEIRGDSTSAFTRIVATEIGFLAVGGSSGDALWASPDGADWTELAGSADPIGLGVGVDILDLAVNGDLIAAVVHNGWDGVAGIATSTDGRTWTFTELSELRSGDPDPRYPVGIASYNEGFLVTGTAIWMSTDGVSFEMVHEGIMLDFDPTDPEPDPYPPRMVFNLVAADGATAVAAADSGREILATQDGTTWEFAPPLEGVGPEGDTCWTAGHHGISVNALASGPFGFVAVGDCVPPEAPVVQAGAWTSLDGTAWDQVPLDPEGFGAGTYMSAASAGDRGYAAAGWTLGEDIHATVWISPNGIGWLRTVLGPSDSGLLDVAILDDVVAAVGWNGDRAVVWRTELSR